MDWRDTLQGFLADNPDLPQGNAVADEKALTAPKLPEITIVFERKGRGGKPATIACGFDPDNDAELKSIASRIKQKLACGGSARGGEILVQGDRRSDLAAFLRSLGYRVKC